MAREAAARGDAAAAKRERTRMILGAALGAVTVLLGAAADRAMVRRRKRRVA